MSNKAKKSCLSFTDVKTAFEKLADGGEFECIATPACYNSIKTESRILAKGLLAIEAAKLTWDIVMQIVKCLLCEDHQHYDFKRKIHETWKKEHPHWHDRHTPSPAPRGRRASTSTTTPINQTPGSSRTNLSIPPHPDFGRRRDSSKSSESAVDSVLGTRIGTPAPDDQEGNPMESPLAKKSGIPKRGPEPTLSARCFGTSMRETLANNDTSETEQVPEASACPTNCVQEQSTAANPEQANVDLPDGPSRLSVLEQGNAPDLAPSSILYEVMPDPCDEVGDDEEAAEDSDHSIQIEQDDEALHGSGQVVNNSPQAPVRSLHFVPAKGSTCAPWTIRNNTLTKLLAEYKPPVTDGFLYAAKVRNEEIVKIGYTTAPVSTRFQSVQRSHELELEEDGAFWTPRRIPEQQLRRLEAVVFADLAFFRLYLLVPNSAKPDKPKVRKEYFRIDVQRAEKTINFWLEVMTRTASEPGKELPKAMCDDIRGNLLLQVEGPPAATEELEKERRRALNDNHDYRERIWKDVFDFERLNLRQPRSEPRALEPSGPERRALRKGRSKTTRQTGQLTWLFGFVLVLLILGVLEGPKKFLFYCFVTAVVGVGFQWAGRE